MPKVAGSRLLVLTSASDPVHLAYKVLEIARGRPESWRVSEMAGPCVWLSPEDLAEQAAVLPAWEYQRLHLNMWVESRDRLTSLDDLKACVAFDGVRGHMPDRTYAMGLDVGLKHDATVVALCSRSSAGGDDRVALDAMGRWEGTPERPVELEEVEAWILATWHEYGCPSVVVDPHQAWFLMQRLAKHGVHVVEYTFTPTSISRFALQLLQLVQRHALELPADEGLIDELANVRFLERGTGQYRLDHDAGRHDDRAVALAIAAVHLLDTPSWSVAGLIEMHRNPAPSITGDLWDANF